MHLEAWCDVHSGFGDINLLKGLLFGLHDFREFGVPWLIQTKVTRHDGVEGDLELLDAHVGFTGNLGGFALHDALVQESALRQESTQIQHDKHKTEIVHILSTCERHNEGGYFRTPDPPPNVSHKLPKFLFRN